MPKPLGRSLPIHHHNGIKLLEQPPKESRSYLVPTIHVFHKGHEADWPIIGPYHNDIEIFNQSIHHYHLDGRFLSLEEERIIRGNWMVSIWEATTRWVLGPVDDLKPILKEKMCTRES